MNHLSSDCQMRISRQISLAHFSVPQDVQKRAEGWVHPNEVLPTPMKAESVDPCSVDCEQTLEISMWWCVCVDIRLAPEAPQAALSLCNLLQLLSIHDAVAQILQLQEVVRQSGTSTRKHVYTVY